MAAFGAASSGIIPTLGAIWVLTKSRLGPAPVPISCAFAPASRNHPEITRLAPLGAGRSDTERWRIVIAVMVGSAAGLVRQRARPRRRRRRAAQAAQGPAQAAPGRTPNAEHTRRRVRPAQSASGPECVWPRAHPAQSTPGAECVQKANSQGVEVDLELFTIYRELFGLYEAFIMFQRRGKP